MQMQIYDEDIYSLMMIFCKGPFKCYVKVFCPGFQKGRVPSEKGTLVRWTDHQKGTLARWTDRQKGTLARWTEEIGHY